MEIYDCTGNVYEWSYDTSTSGYMSEEFPYIYDSTQKNRILRGGAWYNRRGECEVIKRVSNGGSVRSEICGFRIVRTI